MFKPPIATRDRPPSSANMAFFWAPKDKEEDSEACSSYGIKWPLWWTWAYDYGTHPTRNGDEISPLRMSYPQKCQVWSSHTDAAWNPRILETSWNHQSAYEESLGKNEHPRWLSVGLTHCLDLSLIVKQLVSSAWCPSNQPLALVGSTKCPLNAISCCTLLGSCLEDSTNCSQQIIKLGLNMIM